MQIVLFLIALILSIITGYIMIPVLKRMKFGQVVRNDGPQTHLGKAGTPTMGGVIFIIPMIIMAGVMCIKYPATLWMFLVTIGFGVVGFLDDYIKVVLKRSKGLNPKQKMLGLLVISALFGYYIYSYSGIGTSISIPFFSTCLDFARIPMGQTVMNFTWAFIPFIIIVLLSATNSVNLTDGLDGLATGICLIIMLFFTLVAVITGNIPVVIFSATTAGACLGFLFFNMYPAKVFMGDTGSLALGGAIAVASIMLKMPLILLIVAGVCIAETISVIIQVLVFKRTGKRVFKMAPIHHHFELSGWSENKIVWTFWAITLGLCVIGMLSLRYNVF